MADIKKYLDQAGVEYLWKKLSLEDYPNNEMLIAVINALDESKVDAVEGKQLSTEDYTTEEKEKLNNLENYTLPIASPDVLGGVKIGDNLEVTEEGVLNAQAASNVHYGTTEPTDDGIVMWINPEGDEDEVILTTTNTVGYEPTGDYNPATKKYVDEKITTIDTSKDWNQNDETAADYIENRTHYVVGSTTQEETIFENISLTNKTSFSSAENGHTSLDSEANYTVTWDGIDYICKPQVITNGTTTRIMFGNLSLLSADSFLDTGEPFLIMGREAH